MKIKKTIFIISILFIFSKILLFQLCITFDKGLLNYSHSLDQSISNDFFLENYIIQKPSDSSHLEIFQKYNLTNIFFENRWDNKCTLWDLRTKKTPTKALGFNLLLPLNVENTDALDFEFYLLSNSNKYTLRGNRKLETTYYYITRERNLSIDGLLIKDKKTKKSYQFELVKE